MNKKRILQIIGLLLLLTAIYFSFLQYQDYRKERAHKAWVATLDHSASPNVQILKDTIEIDYLGEQRTLSIYLPPNYEKDSLHYPVIYFCDGQSLFDQKILEGDEWQIDEVMDSIAQIGGQKAIVVGIYSSDDNRLTEYKPFTSPHLPKEKVVSGDKHAEWIATDVKKWIDTRYRTKPEMESTIIGGASLGGLMAYYMITTFSEIYGGAIVFSPSLWVNDKVYELHQGVNLANKRIFLNAGSIEQPTVESIEKLNKILVENGFEKSNLKLDVEKDEGHWHMTWQKGFRKAYPWILGE